MGSGRREQRSEVFVKIQKKIVWRGGGGGWDSNKKKIFFWGGGGVRVDVNEELKFLCN